MEAERTRGAARPLRPSAQPTWRGARAIGIVGGDPRAPRVGYLAATQPVTPDLLALADGVSPDEVFRFAAPCVGGGCGHFADGGCRLARKLAAWLPEVADEPPPACTIRPDCRWWRQEGVAACRRCPQVVTRNLMPSPAMVQVVDQDVPPPGETST